MDWNNIGFKYRDTNGFVRYTWRDDHWDDGVWETDPYLRVHICSTGLNYGQECFEGLKAFKNVDGKVRIFRPTLNAERMHRTATFASMIPVPPDLFVRAVCRVVEHNLDWVPPYGSGGSFYIRPLLFGSGPEIGLAPASEFTFVVFGMPVANYYKDGVRPVDAWVVEDFDRAAPMGTGATKVGGNYAPTFLPTKKARENGYAITLHLDSKTRTQIDEFSTSNFVALTKQSPPTLVAPESPTILRSVTRQSLVELASSFGWKVEERTVPFSELTEGMFAEVAACGTAAVITPIRRVVRGNTEVIVGEGGSEIGPGFKKLFEMLRAVQNGEVKDTFDWMYPKEGL